MAYARRAMEWKKDGKDQWSAKLDTRFTMKTAIMGDGRWLWQIFSGENESPTASGMVNSLGSAKHAMENFLKKKGYL